MPGALKVQYIVHYFHSHKKEDEEEKKGKPWTYLCVYACIIIETKSKKEKEK